MCCSLLHELSFILSLLFLPSLISETEHSSVASLHQHDSMGLKLNVDRFGDFRSLVVWKSGCSIDKASRPYNSSALPCRRWHVICAKLELQVLKVSRFSVGWFMLEAARQQCYIALLIGSRLPEIGHIVKAHFSKFFISPDVRERVYLPQNNKKHTKSY